MRDKNIKQWGLVRGSTIHSLITPGFKSQLRPIQTETTNQCLTFPLLWNICKMEATQLPLQNRWGQLMIKLTQGQYLAVDKTGEERGGSGCYWASNTRNSSPCWPCERLDTRDEIQKSPGWWWEWDSVGEHLYNTLKKGGGCSSDLNRSVRCLHAHYSNHYWSPSPLLELCQTRQMDPAFLKTPKIEMYRYGGGEDSEGRLMNDGLSLHPSYFVDLLLNNSSFVLTINQLIPLFCSS